MRPSTTLTMCTVAHFAYWPWGAFGNDETGIFAAKRWAHDTRGGTLALVQDQDDRRAFWRRQRTRYTLLTRADEVVGRNSAAVNSRLGFSARPSQAILPASVEARWAVAPTRPMQWRQRQR
jgi:hypothetical protein